MKKIAIYVHIPFCKQKCKYCDFNSRANQSKDLQEKYVQALCREIEAYKEKVSEYEVASVYFGGGTPSFIDENLIEQILEEIRENYFISDTAEITIEANPGTIDLGKLVKYKEIGINRISFGVQAMQDEILASIGRCHTASEAIEGYKLAREARFDNISLDLMFGLPNQTLQDVEETLDEMIKMNPEHISAYSLKVEENTVFGRIQSDGKLTLPDENTEREMYYLVKKRLKEAGYEHYEISNFAKPGFESRHNTFYWERVSYLGFGVSAASCFEETRFANEGNISTYIAKNGESVALEKEKLDEMQIASERIFLGLRMLRGISEDLFVTEEWKKELENLIEVGLIERSDSKVKLTDKGLDLANQVFMRFV